MHSPSPVVALPFAVFFVAGFLSKLIHLYIHASAAPFIALLFFLPTLFLPDILVLATARLLLRGERGLLSFAGYVLGCVLTIITLGAAAAQLGFFYETGGELEWRDAGSFANSEEGRDVLLSGGMSVLASAIIILAISWFVRNALYRAAGNCLTTVGQLAVTTYRQIRKARRHEELPLEDMDSETDSDSDSDYDSDEDEPPAEGRSFLNNAEKNIFLPARRYANAIPTWAVTTVFLLWFGIAAICRPHKPYHHMSTTLPVSLLVVFKASPDYCTEQQRLTANEWPLTALVNNTEWEDANGHYKGWAPGLDSPLVDQYRQHNPDWLPQPPPRGFARWDPQRYEKSFLESVSAPDSKTESDNSEGGDVRQNCEGVKLQDSFYNPVDDPMRITNLDTDILEPLRQAMGGGSVKVKHVVFVLMESLREEVFPIQKDSDIYKIIMDSNDLEDQDDIQKLVSRMTPNIERITGKSGGFDKRNTSIHDTTEDPEWIDKTKPGFGGINVVGGFSPSSVSTKSIAASHCGVWPMAVNMFEEAETESYQPCIPQILDLFNQLKNNDTPSDFRDQKWHSAFYQAVTDTYDRQNVFDEKIGFDELVSRKNIRIKTKDNPAAKEINYFGFAENILKSYITDLVTNVTANDERMFLTHFTSTTHHPWSTPTWFDTETYMGHNGVKRHGDFNKYLNTIRFHDSWMGELMQLFDDLDISNETLVVFAGDHGQAFKEDGVKQGTYGNAHISNFRVPITFRHPHLPSYQYEANATTVSVLPTILDLLINTGSLNTQDTEIASDIIHDYEGQSLIRPYKTSHNGRRAWNYGIVNGGGGMLTITSADAPWRLAIPLDEEVAWRVTDLKEDPLELAPLETWTHARLTEDVRDRFGDDAAQWVGEADEVAQWWVLERKRLWRYHSA